MVIVTAKDRAKLLDNALSANAKINASAAKSRSAYKEDEDEKKLRREAAERLEKENKKGNTLEGIIAGLGDFAAGANDAFLGGTIKSAAQAANFVGSGFNGKEADRRTKEFMKTVTGQSEENGDTSFATRSKGGLEDVVAELQGNRGRVKENLASDEQAQRFSQNSGTYKTGRAVGEAERIATDIATSVIPGAAAEKALRGTAMFSRLAGAGTKGRIAAEVGGSVGGGLAASAVGAVKDPTNAGDGLVEGIGLDAALGLLGGGGSAIARARRGSKAAEQAVDTQKALPQGKLPEEELAQQKLLEEPGESFYAPERAEIDDELRAINELDPDALEARGLMRQAKDDGRLADAVLQNPERKQLTDEATQKLVQAEDQVKYYNDLKVQSPYHRQLDKVEDARNSELEQLNLVAADSGADPADIKQLSDEINAKHDAEIQRLAQKYPQDAAEAPLLDEALQKATMDQLDAQSALQKAADEDFDTIKKSGGMLREPDVDRISTRKKELETRQKQINDNLTAAKARRETPPTSVAEADKRSDDFFDTELPEFRKADGSLDKAKVKEAWRANQVERASLNRKEATQAVENPKVKETPEQKDAFVEEAELATNFSKGQNFTQLFQTPRRFIRKLGLNKLADDIEHGFDGYRKGLNTTQSRLQKLSNDNKLSAEGKVKVSDALNGKTVSLNPSEQRVFNDLQGFFKEYADKVGLKEERRIADYFPHMYDNAAKDQIPFELREVIDKKFSSKTKAGSLDYSRLADNDAFIKDPIKVALAYGRQAERRIHMQPVFENMNKVIKNGNIDEHTANYLNSYGRYLKGDQTAVDKFVDDVTRGTGNKVLRGVRANAYRANLQMNLSTAIRNLTQATNTAAEIGFTRTMQGGLKTVEMLSKAAKGDRRMMDELNEMGVYDDPFHTDGEVKVVAKALQKFDKVGWAMFQATEKLNRGTAYFGAKAKYLAKHPGKEEQAKKYAADAVSKTQFHFNEMDQPPVLRSQAARTAAQYQSFNIKQGEYLADMLGGSKKEIAAFFKGDPKGAENTLKALRWTGANLAMAAALGEVMGVKFTDMIPNPLDQRNYGSPAIQLLFGDGKGGEGLFDIATGKQDAQEKLYDENGDEVTDPIQIRLNKLGSFLSKTLPAVQVPWYTQAKKSVEGLDTVDKGYSETESGNIRFGVDQNDGARLQAGLFGQYTLPEAQEFYGGKVLGFGEQNGRNLSPQASDKVKSAPEGERDEYLTFYQNATKVTGRQKANKEITQLFQDGQPEKARRKAAEFNAKVDEAMAPYYSAYKDEDPELEEELNSSLYIRLTERGEKQRAKV